MLAEILDHLRAHPCNEEVEVTGDLVVQYDNDSVLHVLSDPIPDVIAIAQFIVDHPGDEDFSYHDGVLTIHTAQGPLHYQPLYLDAQLGWDGEGVTLAEPIIARRVQHTPREALR